MGQVRDLIVNEIDPGARSEDPGQSPNSAFVRRPRAVRRGDDPPHPRTRRSRIDDNQEMLNAPRSIVRLGGDKVRLCLVAIRDERIPDAEA